jgi:hypothetical protein
MDIENVNVYYVVQVTWPRQKYRIGLCLNMRGLVVRIAFYYGPVYYFGLYHVLLVRVPYSFCFLHKYKISQLRSNISVNGIKSLLQEII